MVKDSLQEQGKQALSWYAENYLQANPDKFQMLTINPSNVNISQQNQDIIIIIIIIKTIFRQGA